MLSLFAEINPNIIRNISKEINWLKYETYGEINFPLETLPEVDLIHLSNIIFENSAKCLSDSQVYDYINLWVYQGKTYDLIKIVDKRDTDVSEDFKSLVGIRNRGQGQRDASAKPQKDGCWPN